MRFLATSAERIENVSLVVSIAVIVVLFIVLTLSFALYFRYYRRCIDVYGEDLNLRRDIKATHRKFFREFEALRRDQTLSTSQKIKIYRKHTLVDEVHSVPAYKKVLKALLNIGLFLVYACFIAILVLASYVRASGELFYIGNQAYIVLLSGSMETVAATNVYIEENNLTNQISTFSLIGLEKLNTPEQVELYDVIAYYNEDGDLVVHRVIDIDSSGEAPLYTLRGDANAFSNEDEKNIPYERLVAEYTGYESFGLGLSINYLRSNIGLIAVSLGLILVGVYDIFDSAVGRRIKARKEELYPLIDEENLALLRGEVISESRSLGQGEHMVPVAVSEAGARQALRTLLKGTDLVFKTDGARLMYASVNGDELLLHLKLMDKAKIRTPNTETHIRVKKDKE